MKQLIVSIWLLLLSLGAFCTVVVTEHISFSNNSFSLDSNDESRLRQLFPLSEGLKVEKIDIEGHCDFTGPIQYNLELSKKRALAVYNILASQFPDEGDYEIRYVGEFHPISIHDPEQNRCVVVTMYLLEPEAMFTAFSPADLFPEEYDQFVQKQSSAPEVSPSLAASSEEIQPPFEADFLPTEIEDNTQFRMEKIFFHGNSAKYRESSEESLGQLLAFMKYHDSMNIRLEGHVNGRMGSRYMKKSGTNNPEKRAYKNGQELSLARAESIKEYLVDEGIDPSRIECLGKGGTEKIYKRPKNQRENQANRRIEVVILNK